MPERHDNTIYKLFLKSKKTIKVILNNMTRIRPTIYIEDFKEAPSVNYVYVEEDTEIKETTIADIVTTSHPVKSNAIFIINLNTS